MNDMQSLVYLQDHSPYNEITTIMSYTNNEYDIDGFVKEYYRGKPCYVTRINNEVINGIYSLLPVISIQDTIRVATRSDEKKAQDSGRILGSGERENINFALPSATFLGQNYPNPFNDITVIPISLSKNCIVSLRIYNLVGQLVKTLLDEQMPAGRYNVSWDASQYASGIYFYKLQVGDYVTARKMNLVK
jgi:hypothetical protein